MKFHPRFWARLGGFLAGLAVSPLAAQIHSAPPNDLFAHRTDLGRAETVEVSQKFLRASVEWGEPEVWKKSELVTSYGDVSLWWQWTAPRDGLWEIALDPTEPFFSSGSVRVYEGTNIRALSVAADDGAAVFPYGRRQRVLLRAEAGKSYQIRVVSHTRDVFPAVSHAAFVLRPVAPALNRTPETPDVLPPDPQAEGQRWTLSAWGYHPKAQAPWVAAEDRAPLYAPRWWTWTAPRAGWVGVSSWGIPDHATACRIYRGANPDPARLLPPGNGRLPVSAGETLLFASGSEFIREAVDRFEVSMRYVRDPGEEIPENRFYTLTGELPLVVSPPAAATPAEWVIWPESITWQWADAVTGWIELDGEGLEFYLRYASTGGLYLTYHHEGKVYFWSQGEPLTFTVFGWQWPQGGQFSIRHADLPPPAHDTASDALELGHDFTAIARIPPLGATFSEGEPFYPSVWFQWTAPADSVARIGREDVRVYAGPDENSLSLVPNLFGEPSSGWCFRTEAGRRYWIAASGGEVELECARPGAPDATHPATPVTELPWNSVSGVWAMGGPSTGMVFFKTTALTSGWLSVGATLNLLQVFKGGSFESKELVMDLEGASTPRLLEAVAGTTYWFAVAVENTATMTAFFSFQTITLPLPGETADAAIDLGHRFPVQAHAAALPGPPDPLEARLLGEGFSGSTTWFKWTAPADAFAARMDGLVLPDIPEGEPLMPLYADDTMKKLYHVIPGKTYYILVAYESALTVARDYQASLSLEPRYPVPLANDSFANPVVVTGSPVYVTEVGNEERMEVAAQSVEEGEPLAMAGEPAAVYSVWCRWTAPYSGLCALNTLELKVNSQGGGVLSDVGRKDVAAVYEGESLSALRRVPTRLLRSGRGPVLGREGRYFWGYRQLLEVEEGKDYRIQLVSSSPAAQMTFYLGLADDYDRWALAQPGLDPARAEPEDNPSGDGLPNLLKFTLGLHPAFRVEEDPQPERVPRYTLAPDGRQWRLQFWSERYNTGNGAPGDPASPGMCSVAQIVAEASEDLQGWHRLTGARSLGDNVWEVSLPYDPAHANRYLRLRAQWCPFFPPD